MHKLLLPCVLVAYTLFGFYPLHAQVVFENVTPALNIGDPGSESVIWFDYNNDGALDLFVNGSSSTDLETGSLFFHNQGRFTQMANVSKLSSSKTGAASGDYDNDGDIDLFLAGLDDLSTIYRNNGDGTFDNATQESGLFISPGSYIITCSFFDYNNDGWLDLFLGSLTASDFMFRNNGDGTFTDVTEATGLKDQIRNTTGHMFGDYNNDGAMDLYVSSQRILVGTLQSSTRNQIGALYRNSGDGTFTDVTQQANLSYSELDVYDVQFFDYNNDGWLDLFLPTWGDGNSSNLLYRNVGDGSFRNVATLARVTGRTSSRSVTGGDFDNDGYVDLYTGNDGFDFGSQQYRDADKYSNQLYLNNQDGTFLQRASQFGVNDEEITFNVSSADYDGDGFVDLYVANGRVLQRNEGQDILFRSNGNTNHWLQIDLVGVQSNRSGIGARITVTAGGLSMVREIHGGDGHGDKALTAEFGLGAQVSADRVEIRWPSGQSDVVSNVPGDQKIRIIEGQQAFHSIRPVVWVHTVPSSISLGSPFEATATIRPEFFEASATVTSVKLSGLGDGRSVELQDMGDGTYQLNESSLTLSGAEGERILAFLIHQETSLGSYITTLPVIVNATEALPAKISLVQGQIVFGEIDRDLSGSATVVIKNEGQGTLVISEIRSDIAGLVLPEESILVLPGGSETITLSFNPQAEGAFSGVLELISNDSDAGTVRVDVSGSVVVIPGDPRADVDGSGVIDFPDFLAFASVYGNAHATLDFDGSGLVDFADFLQFVKIFGKSIN